MTTEESVLIIDDVDSNMEILGSCLKDTYDIKYASNGLDALNMIHSDPPDLILLDIEMPDMDGFEVLEELKKTSHNHIPVIFVTGHRDIQKEERGLINGAVDYITKPISPIIVKARVKTHITIKNQRDQLVYRAAHDQLTQLYNRHKLVEEGNRFFSKALRYNETFCVAILDIDYFKKINDTYGHIVGDDVLKSVANLLSESLQTEDIIARYGGEEFIIIFDKCLLHDAMKKADILRMKIYNLKPNNINVTASFGVSCINNNLHNDFDHLLQEADDALYKAKKNGRNQVMIYEK